MSGHKYIADPNSLFEDDVDDETFLANSRNSASPAYGGNPSLNPIEQQRQMYEQKRRAIEERTLQSTDRSIGLLLETEDVGQATAAELAKQREQLERSNRQLDDITATLRFSQKHLNGLKSVFGGLKNYLSGGRNEVPPPSSAMTSKVGSAANIAQSQQKAEPQTSRNNNPFLQSPTSSADEIYNNHPINRLRSDNVENIQSPKSVRSEFEERLESNLDDMCNSISRLKGLATNMHEEIESQNELLDNMNYKIEDVDMKIGKQNKQINTLLGKK